MRAPVIMSDKDGKDSPNRAEESFFPFMMGFFLFWIWTAEDFPLLDKLTMTSLVFGLEFLLVLGLSQPLRKMEPRSLS